MRQKAEIDAVIATWNAMAEKAKAAGIPIYSHTHAEPWDFLLDSGPQDASGNYTRSSGIRVMEYFLDHTDARWVKLEMDIFWAHVAQFRFSTYTAPDGSTATSVFDPAATAGRYKRRCPIFHAKDGIRAPSDPNGWIFCPFGYGDIDLEDFFDRSRSRKTRPWWSYEQDNAPGDAADPQKSLRDSANATAAWRRSARGATSARRSRASLTAPAGQAARDVAQRQRLRRPGLQHRRPPGPLQARPPAGDQNGLGALAGGDAARVRSRPARPSPWSTPRRARPGTRSGVPSGDHAGANSVSGVSVSCRMAPDAASTTHRS